MNEPQGQANPGSQPQESLESLREMASNVGDEELGRLLREGTAAHERDVTAATTDEHGNPLPRLNIDDPQAMTTDPLLRVGYALLAELPERWEAAVLSVTAAADEVRTNVLVRTPDKVSFELHMLYLPETAAACSELRRTMYEADGRVWYNAIIRLNSNGTLVPNYDFQGPPFTYWGPREADLARRDQELYPRQPGDLPPWHPSR
jgi:hypothetical protein